MTAFLSGEMRDTVELVSFATIVSTKLTYSIPLGPGF